MNEIKLCCLFSSYFETIESELHCYIKKKYCLYYYIKYQLNIIYL